MNYLSRILYILENNHWKTLPDKLRIMMFCFIGFPPDTPLVLYEEIKPDFVEKINNYSEPLEKVLFISFIPPKHSINPSYNNTSIYPSNYVFR